MSYLLDSNIIIYSGSKGYEYLRALVINESCAISEVSRVEVLGYHGLKKDEAKYFENIFESASIILPDQDIFNLAIDFRKQYNLKLGDSLIAGTATIYGLEVYTRNLDDFRRVKGLKCRNPIH